MENKDEKPLIIPENCPPMQYVINGFTGTDLSFIAIIGVIFAVIGILIWIRVGNSLAGVGIFLVGIAIAVSIFARNKNSENLIDKIRILIEYRQAQKRFEYKYINIWEVEGKKQHVKKRK